MRDLDGWLKDFKKEGRKPIEAAGMGILPGSGLKLKRILSQVAVWRHVVGRLSHTDALLTSSGEPSRLILGE